MSSKRRVIPIGMIGVIGVIALSAVLAIAAGPVAAKERLEVKFMTHLQMNLPEQDVFIESATDPAKVMRVEGEAGKDPANLAKQAYASASAVPHDPFKVGQDPLGPFAKGAALGLTLGEWLAGTGGGGYTADGDQATLDLSMDKLVPKATYTLWCSRLTFPPNPKVVDKPCGAADGSQNVLKSDASGHATFHLVMPSLEPSTKEVASVLALAYHSDGQTYGADTGAFGLHTHVQLVWLMPAPAAAAVPSTPATASAPRKMPTTGAGDVSLGWALLIGIILVAAGLFVRRPERAPRSHMTGYTR